MLTAFPRLMLAHQVLYVVTSCKDWGRYIYISCPLSSELAPRLPFEVLF